eukprot:Skav217281  [mRNA]  locus=scaffold120:219800:220858:+ [translate_table: standard]
MPLQPNGADERLRANRRAGNVLQADRVVLQQTRDRRAVLLTHFDVWLAEHLRTTLVELLEPRSLNFEDVAEALVAFGKDLYQSGKSYSRFSETINAVTALRPSLRRNVAAAWDLAFNWVVDEPHEHHAALPLTLLIASVSLALLWGWVREAAALALGWAGVLRIGEVFAACRQDLILPEDAAPGVLWALLKIKLPKTRGRAARHQSSRIEPEDIVKLLQIAYSKLAPQELLWPHSPATLRKRFATLLTSLGIGRRRDGSLPYSLSSLRPGGATHWLQATEDAEYVRRKGRWLSTRVLEVYLQEASVMTYQQRLTTETKSRVQNLCNTFPTILGRAQFLKDTNIPEQLWPRLW